MAGPITSGLFMGLQLRQQKEQQAEQMERLKRIEDRNALIQKFQLLKDVYTLPEGAMQSSALRQTLGEMGFGEEQVKEMSRIKAEEAAALEPLFRSLLTNFKDVGLTDFSKIAQRMPLRDLLLLGKEFNERAADEDFQKKFMGAGKPQAKAAPESTDSRRQFFDALPQDQRNVEGVGGPSVQTFQTPPVLEPPIMEAPQPQAPPDPTAGLREERRQLEALMGRRGLGEGQKAAIKTRIDRIDKDLEAKDPDITRTRAQLALRAAGGDVEAQKALDLLRESASTPFQRQDIERAMTEKGWTPGMPGYWNTYVNAAQRSMIPPGGQVVGIGQLIPSPPGGPRAQAPAPTGDIIPPAPGAPAPALAGPAAPSRGPGAGLYERAPSPETASHFVDKETLAPPPTGMSLTAIQQSGRYVQVPTSRIGAISQARVVKGMLDELERIVERRKDLFPTTTGTGAGATAKGAFDLAKAKAYFATPLVGDSDPDIARIHTLSITLPSAIKLFGDTANIAVKEREIAEQALGLRPAMQDAAFGRVDLIRDLVNNSMATAGLPAFKSIRGQKAPTAAPKASTPAMPSLPKVPPGWSIKAVP